MYSVRAKADEESLSPEEAYDGFHPTFTYPVCLSRPSATSNLGET